MLCRRPKPMIGKLSELLVSGKRGTPLDTAISPRSPLDLDLKNMQSPRGFKCSYEVGGVGLGIVVAPDKSLGSEVFPKYALCSANLNRSDPIPIHHSDGFGRGFHGIDMGAAGSLENYTYVTYHVPNNKTLTKVYYDGSVVENSRQGGYYSDKVCNPTKSSAIYIEAEKSLFPTSDFLSSCHLCAKDLHGKDIYMYRGEKAFCSSECRSKQIMMDESKEASRSLEVASSPAHARDQIFSTGILVI